MPYADKDERRRRHTEYMRRWRAANREKVREAVRRYRAAHRKEAREYMRLYRAAHPAKVVEWAWRRRTVNRKKYNARMREYNRQWRAARRPREATLG